MILLLACAWAVAVAWVIWRAAAQRSLFEPLSAALAPAQYEFVAVVVPARNEEANIGSCLEGLLRQTYPGARWRALVVDDHSEDATLAEVQAIAARDSHVEAMRSAPLPPGWVGKCHACWSGAAAAPPEASWLCFIDADVRVEPELLACAVANAAAEGLDLLSLSPRQELGSFAERLVMPCGLYIMAVRQDLGELQAPDSGDATVTGQFILVRRAAYEAAGGHRAVRGAIAEDVALGRAVKRAGGRVALRDGAGLLRARMYTGWDSLWEGVSKNLVDMLGGPGPTLVTAAFAAAFAWAALAVPVICAVAGPAPSLVLAAAASLSLIGLHVAGARYFRIPLWYGLLFPLGYTAGAFLAVDSVIRRRRGRVIWKGRTYP